MRALLPPTRNQPPGLGLHKVTVTSWGGATAQHHLSSSSSTRTIGMAWLVVYGMVSIVQHRSGLIFLQCIALHNNTLYILHKCTRPLRSIFSHSALGCTTPLVSASSSYIVVTVTSKGDQHCYIGALIQTGQNSQIDRDLTVDVSENDFNVHHDCCVLS